MRAQANAAVVDAPTLDQSSLQGRLSEAFGHSLAQLSPDSPPAPVVTPADARFGDYQCNNAMSLFKQQPREEGKPPLWKSPKDAAEAIKGSLPTDVTEILEQVAVSPQGFVTVRLKPDWVQSQVRRLFKEGPQYRAGKPQRIVIDYSSPNIAKEMHVGHLRSTILGDAVANLFQKLGHDVVRLNHVGDWGTQFGMLLEYMKRGESLGESELAIRDLQKFYRSAKKCFDEDTDFRKAAQTNVVALQSGEAWARTAWQKICAASRSEFDLVYQRLQIRGLSERGESFYNGMLPEVVETLTTKGLVKEDSGAKCVFTSVSEAPLIVQKADGGFGYDSTDCAAVLHRLTEEKADRVIYVIDNGQESHMRMVFEVADKAGWLTRGQRLDFMGFGLVQGEDGKKFKTRSGDVVRLRDLLDEAASRAEVELRRRVGAKEEAEGDIVESLTPEREAQLKADAERIGVAAVKYFDLRQNRNSDYRFSYDAMLDPKGNTAVYVLYAYARISAILRRAGREVTSLNPDELLLEKACERALGLRLLRLPEVLIQVQDDLLPSRLIEYVYGLAVDFTTFYMECPVVGSPQEASRLMICEVTRRALAECLALLGIEPLEQI